MTCLPGATTLPRTLYSTPLVGLALGGLAFGAAALVGCGTSSSIACAPVKGHISRGNQPVSEALVVFHPLGTQAADPPRPIAYTDANGNFVLTMIAPGDGAPPGQYAITVELRESRLVGEEQVRDGRNLLPPQYADPKSSPLKYTVVPGTNEVPPIAIESR